MSTFYSSYSGVNGGGGGSGVSSLNTLSGALTLVGGSGITITPSGGNTLTIAATGSGSSGANGAVQFSDGSGGFNSDGADFFWDNSNKRLGIGLANPLTTLHVASSGSVNLDHGITQENNSANNAGASLILKKSRGTHTSPTAVQSGDFIGKVLFYGYGTTYNAALPDAAINAIASETFTGVAHGTQLNFNITPIGSTTRQTIITLQADNGIAHFNSSAAASLTTYYANGGTSYSVIMPANQGTGALTNDGAGNLSWDSGGLTNPLDNNTFLQGRNAANDAIFNLIGVDPSDFLQIGGAVGGAGQPVQIRVGDTANQQGLKLNGTAAFLIASQAADAGDIILQGQTVQMLPAPSSAASTTLQFHDAAATNYTGFKSPDTLSATNTYTLPDGDGSANNVLSTDGAGNLSWISGGSGATTALDNLASVAINTDLIFDGSFNAQIKTSDNGSGATKFLRLATGNAISGASGEITIRPGDSDTAPGQLTLEGALASDADVNGGEILVHTLPTTGTGNSGQLRFISGDSVDGNSGDLSLIAGTPSGTGLAGRIFLSAALQLPATNTTAGTTGNQTINKPSGTVNFATAASSLTVTNSLVTANSIVFAVVRTNDAAAVIKNVVPTLGSFTITLNAAAGAETSVGFMVINQ